MFFVPFALLGFGLRALDASRGCRFYRLKVRLHLAPFILIGLALRAFSAAGWPPADAVAAVQGASIASESTVGRVLTFVPLPTAARASFVAALPFILIPLLYNASLSRNAGLWLMALGGLLHFTVVVANGGRMPVWDVHPAHPLYVPAPQARLADRHHPGPTSESYRCGC